MFLIVFVICFFLLSFNNYTVNKWNCENKYKMLVRNWPIWNVNLKMSKTEKKSWSRSNDKIFQNWRSKKLFVSLPFAIFSFFFMSRWSNFNCSQTSIDPLFFCLILTKSSQKDLTIRKIFDRFSRVFRNRIAFLFYEYRWSFCVKIISISFSPFFAYWK